MNNGFINGAVTGGGGGVRRTSSGASSTGSRRSCRSNSGHASNIKIQQVFDFEIERSEKCLKDDRYDEAYAFIKKEHTLGPQLQYARHLVRYYKVAILTKRSEEASKIRDRLIHIVRQNLPSAAASDVKTFAYSLSDAGKFVDAILFYQVAAAYYEHEPNANIAVGGIRSCCWGMRETNAALVAGQKKLKWLVAHHVIPLMRGLRDRIHRLDELDEPAKVEKGVWCLTDIEHNLHLVGDHDSREQTLKEGIELMKAQFAHDCAKYRVYGALLHNLGHTYETTGRPELAVKAYAVAANAKKKAEDYQDEEERREDVESSEIRLSKSKNKLLL